MTDDPIPSRVKIGYRDYTIEVMTDLKARKERRFGEFSHVDGVISIDIVHAPAENGNTLLHEIIHGVFQIWPIGKDDEEEHITATLSNGLATVWRDNPAVFEWINRQLSSQAA